jgi:hypothetical protein
MPFTTRCYIGIEASVSAPHIMSPQFEFVRMRFQAIIVQSAVLEAIP